MKNQFLLDDSIVFLNHGSFGACPKPVFQIYQNWQREMERNPVEFLGRRSGELLHEARVALARYLHASDSDLAFIPNATTGVNIVARSLALAPGDVILTTDHEYGACDNTWAFVAAQTGATIERAHIALPYERANVIEKLWAHVTEKTRVIALSHMTSATALIFPVEAICQRARECGILTVVDGAHVPGHLPLDLGALAADFYVGNCHKWLCAPKSAAFLHVRAEHHARLQAPVISWGYSDCGEEPSPRDAFTGRSVLERRLQWQGTRDIAAYLSIPACIEFQAAHDWAAVRARCHDLACELDRRVRERSGMPALFGPADFGQMVAIAIPPTDPVALQARLFDTYRIEVPVTTYREHVFVRVSVQAYTDEADLDALDAALADVRGTTN